MEAGQFMSKSLPPKINLHEGREKEREEGGGSGDRRTESPVQWNKNCAISLGTAWWTIPRRGAGISCGFVRVLEMGGVIVGESVVTATFP